MPVPVEARVPAKTSAPATGFYQTHGKRVLDLVLVFLSLPFFLPLIALFYVLVRLDGGPGFFSHPRVGRGGRPFRCHKLRTMIPDAETALRSFLAENPDADAQWRCDYKLDGDFRVTRLGGFLRRTGLDELPQIWNVVKGDMALVGPRPVTMPELAMYGEALGSYFAIRPGLTGPWQVGGRNAIPYDARVAIDRSYADRYSLASDLEIVVRTMSTVLNASRRAEPRPYSAAAGVDTRKSAQVVQLVLPKEQPPVASLKPEPAFRAAAFRLQTQSPTRQAASRR